MECANETLANDQPVLKLSGED
jgi:hypothetical protein